MSGKPNRAVVRPVASAIDLVRRSRETWTIYFGIEMSEDEAAEYELPFEYVRTNVLPVRLESRQTKAEKEHWWIYARPRPEMKQAITGLERFVVTPAVAKHRLFVWMSTDFICNQGTLVFARDDDYFFGVLHSKLHEVWSLRMGTSLEDRPRYTPTTTFETFPFPWPPGQEDTASPAHAAISAAAAALHAERDAWLNPPGAPESALKPRTLTNLYNALNVWRGLDSMKTVPAAADFAPRLDALHRALDATVCAAYGWDDLAADDRLYTPAGEEDVLRRLLALNLARAGV